MRVERVPDYVQVDAALGHLWEVAYALWPQIGHLLTHLLLISADDGNIYNFDLIRRGQFYQLLLSGLVSRPKLETLIVT